jgi:hypothetical protein
MNPEVTSRQYSPSATSGPQSAKSRKTLFPPPPPNDPPAPKKSRTQIPMMM